MQIIKELKNYKKQESPIYLALGNFDGVHLGHQKIIQTAVEKAHANRGLSGAFIFDPHPLNVLKPSLAPRTITDTKTKAELLEALGLDILIYSNFTEQISLWSPREFVQRVLVESLAVTEVFVGFNYSFGHKGQGTPEMLQILGKEYGFGVNITQPVKKDGEAVSSTWIRKALDLNDVKTVCGLLGHGYY